MDAQVWTAADAARSLHRPTDADDKYSRGVVGLRTGSDEYPGAAVLGVEAAWRTGVGMVRYTGPASGLVLQRRPETVVVDGRAQAWVIGSGTDAGARTAAETLALRGVLASGLPVVVDAGALDLVAGVSSAGDGGAASTAGDGGAASPAGEGDAASPTGEGGETAGAPSAAGGREASPPLDGRGASPLFEGRQMLPDPGAERHLGSLERVSPASAPLVLTPHDGEHARLRARLGLAAVVDRVAAARETASALGATVLLKGAETVVATPSGWTALVRAECPWLATAGTGDVLAGVLGALVAGAAARNEQQREADASSEQQVAPDAAALQPAAAGVAQSASPDGGFTPLDVEALGQIAASAAWLHGRAGALAAGSLGPVGGPITALDVAEALPRAVAELL